MRDTPRPQRLRVGIDTRIIWLVSLIPLITLCGRGMMGELTANPIEYISKFTGWWTLFSLLLTLGVTPARYFFSMPILFPLRRTFGLITFVYATIHFLTWLVLDQFFDWTEIALDLSERPFIYIGFVAFLGLCILALTSTNRAKVVLGSVRWRRMHKSVYLIAILGVTHFYILVKSDVWEPLTFGAVLFLLLGYRLFLRLLNNRR
mgnify:FL=1